MMTKSLSKEDLNVERVDADFFSNDSNEEFDVDWGDEDRDNNNGDAPEGGSDRRKTHLARSRRLGPGDRRKELMRRNSSRRMVTDGTHGDGNPRSRSNSVESDDVDLGGRRGLSRRASSRSVDSNDSKQGMFPEKSLSKKNVMAGEPSAPPGKMTIKSLREDLKDRSGDLEMSFSDLPKEWQVSSSSNAAAASFLPSSQRAPRSKVNTNNPRHRRNSLNGSTPLQRRLSSRGLMQDGAAAGNAPANEDSATRRTPRRHSLMGDINNGDGMSRVRSNRNLGADDAGRTGGGRRTTTVPRRSSTGGGAGCRDFGVSVGRRPSVSNTTPSLVMGEAIAGGLRW